jgi:hypothetical protein
MRLPTIIDYSIIPRSHPRRVVAVASRSSQVGPVGPVSEVLWVVIRAGDPSVEALKVFATKMTGRGGESWWACVQRVYRV